MSDNNKMPEGWGQNKGVPDSWGKNNNLPENWGNQNSGVKIPSLIHENQINVNEELEMLSNMAKSGTKMLNKAARKAGDSVKNAAGSVVEYVKSDETKEKLNAVKDKAKFIADVTECAVSDIKEKTSDKINKLRLPKSEATVPDNNVSDNVSEDINNDIEETDIAENIEETENSESFDELYEKAMSSADDTEKYDETSDEVTYSAENSVHDENNEESFIATDVDASPGEINEFDTPQAVQPTQIEYAKKKIPVIPCIIVIMLIAAGIFGGNMLIKHNRKSRSNSAPTSNNDTEAQENITETYFSETITSSDIAETSTVEPTSQTSPIETTTVVSTETEIKSTISVEEIESAKNNVISAFKNNNPNISSFNAISDYDINGDNIPEVIISYMGISGDDNYHIYYYDGSQYVKLKECWGGLEISETNHLILEKNYGGIEVSCYYEISNDYKINKIDELSLSPMQNGYSYYRNGRQIDSSEYYAAINYYSDMNWISISSDSMNTVDSSKPIEQPAKEAVNLEGIINSKGAKYVYSYTTEYILYGGKKVEQRLDLENGWHVSAKKVVQPMA